MNQRIRFSAARQVFEAFPTAAADISLTPVNELPLDFARKLLAPGRRFESVVYLAHLLPRREAVWWGCQCVRALDPLEDDALLAAESWVRAPEETNRRDALSLGWKLDARKPTTWLALAAGQSGGSLAPEGERAVPPPPQATAQSVKAAVILAVSRTPTQTQFAWLSACVEAGIRFAEGGDAKVKSPAPAKPSGHEARGRGG
jgi:hypothetical protein